MEGIYGASRYHQLWGKVHPLLVSSDFLQKSSKKLWIPLSRLSQPVQARLDRCERSG
jgi:hypothetical protein